MQPFEYVRAKSTDEAVALLARANGRARVLSGGTDLIVALRDSRIQADLVVDIKFIPEVNQLAFDPATGLQIGAAVPCHRLYGSEPIVQAYPGLIDAASLIGGVQVQGRASLGGNLCNASPAADGIPALIAHGAVAHVAGPGGWRSVPVESFCTAPGRTVLQAGEFLVSLHLPSSSGGFGAAYLRFIPRNEMDIAVVGAGVSVQLDESRSHFVAARVALAAVAPTPLFVQDAGDALIGKPVSQAAVDEAARLAQEAAQPISDMRGTADYRRHLVGVFVRRALAKALARAGAVL
jgi:CO/xanthine dehydrogenase FAD-binding subunit